MSITDTTRRVRPSRSRASVRASESDSGVALILALLLAVALTAIGGGLLVLANTETFASMNYRMMSQARYGAEAGVLRAVNHLTQAYQAPGLAGDPLTNYDMTVSPVTYNGAPVVLSADPNKASNYPNAVVGNAFAAAVQGTFNGAQAVTYTAYATLISMRTITEYGATTPRVIQTWQLTGTGSLGASRPATVEVTATLERQVTSAHAFGVFATKPGCGALTFSGGSVNDSYDSSNITLANGSPVTDPTGGRVGTNGNLTVNGQAQVYGTLSTPRVGVGNCKNGSITALTGGSAQVSEGMVQLPQSIVYPTPAPPNPLPPTTSLDLDGSTCASLGLTAPGCAGAAGNITLDPQGGTMSFGNVSHNAGGVVHLKAGTYNLNSIKINGNATLIIDTGPVFMNIAGVGTNQPIDFSGGAINNPSYDPTMFQIVYGGTSDVTITGGSASAAMLYAPNAKVTLAGGSHFYGSIVGSEVKDTGGSQFHYDRRLSSDFLVAGNFMMSAFTWKKY